jgi:hypothetical protein
VHRIVKLQRSIRTIVLFRRSLTSSIRTFCTISLKNTHSALSRVLNPIQYFESIRSNGRFVNERAINMSRPLARSYVLVCVLLIIVVFVVVEVAT